MFPIELTFALPLSLAFIGFIILYSRKFLMYRVLPEIKQKTMWVVETDYKNQRYRYGSFPFLKSKICSDPTEGDTFFEESYLVVLGEQNSYKYLTLNSEELWEAAHPEDKVFLKYREVAKFSFLTFKLGPVIDIIPIAVILESGTEVSL